MRSGRGSMRGPGVAVLRVMALSAALALAVAACGDPGPTGNGDGGAIGAIDACSLLTPAEIEEELGKPISPGVRASSSGNAAGCEWVGVTDTDAISVTATITELDPDLWAIQKGSTGVEPVPGIGDEAIRGWVTQDLLTIRKGSMAIDFAAISVFGERTVTMAAQVELAKLLVSRL